MILASSGINLFNMTEKEKTKESNIQTDVKAIIESNW
jgi:hypothetical protein